MPRPSCRLHPDGTTERRGYYGKHKEFIRWVCHPPNGDPAHYLRRDQKVETRVKLVGGFAHGSCDECERVWLETDGLPNGDFDKFVLREKARALVRVAEGMTYNSAAFRVRQRAARRHGALANSIDGRMVRDWVGQHTEILAKQFLPEIWPEAICVDSFDVRITAFKKDGSPMQKGLPLYEVMGAAGYGPHFGRAGKLWHLKAVHKVDEGTYRDFFSELGGHRNVKIVVCDGDISIANAARWAFPNAEVYPCIWHLFENLERHLRRAKLWNNKRAIYKQMAHTHHHSFWTMEKWEDLLRVLERYLAADLSKLDEKRLKAMQGLARWLQRNEKPIDRVLVNPHWPRDLKLLEEKLATIRDHRFGDRRRSFRNLDRLNLLLKLMLIDLRGEADSVEWARILRENHARHHGHPPPRRKIDGKVLKVRGQTVIVP
jgi:hypothetical protein